MQPTRRDFLKLSTLRGTAVSVLVFDLAPAYAAVRELKIARTTETRSTCPYCSVSCGVIIHTLGDRSHNVKPRVVHVEGDPDHPIDRKSTRLNSSHLVISYAVFCLKKKTRTNTNCCSRQ